MNSFHDLGEFDRQQMAEHGVTLDGRMAIDLHHSRF